MEKKPQRHNESNIDGVSDNSANRPTGDVNTRQKRFHLS